MSSRDTQGRCALILGLVLCQTACGDIETAAPDPIDTVHRILAVHGLDGATIDHRAREAVEKRVSPEILAELFTDYRAHDPFLRELYVGFVTGALARFRDRLVVERGAQKAVVSAGRVAVVMRLGAAGWQVDLAASIPAGIKARARMAQAKVNGRMRDRPVVR